MRHKSGDGQINSGSQKSPIPMMSPVGVGVDVGVGVGVGGTVPFAKNCPVNATSPTVSRCTPVKACASPPPAALPCANAEQLNGAPMTLTGPKFEPSVSLALSTTAVAVPVTAGDVASTAMSPPGGSSAVQKIPSGPYVEGALPVQAPSTTVIPVLLSTEAE